MKLYKNVITFFKNKIKNSEEMSSEKYPEN